MIAYPEITNQRDLLLMLDELADHRADILAACDRLTPAQLADSVVAGTWSVVANLAHLAWAEEWMLAWVKARPGLLPEAGRPVEGPHEFDAVRTALDEAHAAMYAFVKGHPASVLAEPCRYGRVGRHTTVGGVLFHLVEHEIHHRGIVRFKLGLLTR